METTFIKVLKNVAETEKEILWTDNLKIAGEGEDQIRMIYKFFMPDICKNFYGNRYYLAREIAGKYKWKVLAGELMSKETDLENFLDCISFMVTFNAVAIIVRKTYPKEFHEQHIVQMFDEEFPKIKKRFEQEYSQLKTREDLLNFLQIEGFEKIES